PPHGRRLLVLRGPVRAGGRGPRDESRRSGRPERRVHRQQGGGPIPEARDGRLRPDVMTSATPRRSVTIPAQTGHLAEVRSFVREATAAFGAPGSVADDLVQAVDEAVCNVILHGYRGFSGEIEVGAEARDGRIEIRILDRSAATFDP